MKKLSFYFDEDIQRALYDALRTRGVDVLTTHQAGNVGADDIRQLAYAADRGRTMLSYNKRHFALLHYEWMNTGRPTCWDHSFGPTSDWRDPSPSDEALLLLKPGGHEK